MVFRQRLWRRLIDAVGGIGVVVLVPTLLALLLYVALFALAMFRQPTWPHLIVLLDVWQTQTGAAFALAAALIGAAAIVRQTTATERRAEARQKRRADALRAMLPLVLSELTTCARRCALIYAPMLNPQLLDHTRHLWSSGKQTIPPLPTGFRDFLTDLIETSDLDDKGPLIELVRFVHIQHARALELQDVILSPNDPVSKNDAADRVIDAAEVIARCDKLLPYARGAALEPSATISSEDVEKAVSALPTGLAVDIDIHIRECLKGQVERHVAQGRWRN